MLIMTRVIFSTEKKIRVNKAEPCTVQRKNGPPEKVYIYTTVH